VAVRTYSPTGDGTVAVDVVPAGTWQLLVSAAGTATVETTVRVPGPTVPVALPAARTLTVRAPAFAESRATLTLTGQDGRPFRQLVQTALQDRFLLVRGQAQVTGLPHGSWALRVEGEDGSVLSGVASTEGGVTEVVLE
jgi:hypothetical protein